MMKKDEGAKIRMECLKLAVGLGGDDPTEIIKLAAFFYLYASGDIKVTPNPPPEKKDE